MKSYIDNKGVHSEAGTDEVVVDVRIRKGVQKFAPDAGGAITKSVAIFEAPSAGVGVTGTLPPVSEASLGMEVTVINADSTADLLLSASTGNPIDGGTLLYNVAEEAATLMAVSSSLSGYSWIVTSVKA